MGKRKFIIDTDAGIDDAQAILMALAYTEEVDVIALTTTHGNVSCENVTLNVLRLLKIVGRLDIPVFPGAIKPLVGKRINSTGYHGDDGFGDVPDPEAPGRELAQSEHAVQTLIRLVNQSPGDIELVCLGPLTNIALALRIDPDLGSKVKHCYIMGGNYEGVGNVTDTAEFNFYCDPESANIVLTELGCDITMACWELCLKYAFDWDWYFNKFINLPTDKARFIKLIETNTINNFYKASQKKEYMTADQLIMALALNPSMRVDFGRASPSVDCSVTSTRGTMNVDWADCSGNVDIVKAVDSVVYGRLMVNSLNMCE